MQLRKRLRCVVSVSGRCPGATALDIDGFVNCHVVRVKELALALLNLQFEALDLLELKINKLLAFVLRKQLKQVHL